jgi:hypothetical protein
VIAHLERDNFLQYTAELLLLKFFTDDIIYLFVYFVKQIVFIFNVEKILALSNIIMFLQETY